jgi:hypothetical protein
LEWKWSFAGIYRHRSRRRGPTTARFKSHLRVSRRCWGPSRRVKQLDFAAPPPVKYANRGWVRRLVLVSFPPATLSFFEGGGREVRRRIILFRVLLAALRHLSW